MEFRAGWEGVQVYLAHKKQPTSLGPPQGPRHSYGPRSALFLMSEVPLYQRLSKNLQTGYEKVPQN